MTGTVDSTPRRSTPDMILLWTMLALVAAGIIMVFDSSFGQSAIKGGTGIVFLKKQLIAGGVGFIGFFAILKMGYSRLRSWASALIILSIVMLVACYIKPIGVTLNGAHRWIGPGIQFQPSEFAKTALVLYLAALFASYIEKRRYDVTNFWDGLLLPLGVCSIVALLIEREPDLGTSIVVFLSSMTVFFMAGAKRRHIAVIVTVAGLCAMVLMMGNFRGGRIHNWIYPLDDPQGKGFQPTHARLAVGTGSLTGVGFGKGREKYYLPEQNTDFIFATIAEETGWVGSTVIIGLLLVVAWRASVIAQRSKDIFGSLLAGGIGAIISWQALINIAVVTGCIPATGVPLPFISFGGTSLAMLLVSCGILLSISNSAEPQTSKYDALDPVRPRLRMD
ncbi:MAG: putative peptidoglycan glycosyltransferase FtsW [Chthonomonadales bacterium]